MQWIVLPAVVLHIPNAHGTIGLSHFFSRFHAVGIALGKMGGGSDGFGNGVCCEPDVPILAEPMELVAHPVGRTPIRGQIKDLE